jgi:DNA-binding CsgD family transcriptional regulator
MRELMEKSCTCYLRNLTTRELDVATLLAQGLSTETVAGVLALSHHTVTAHLGKMLRNFNAHNRTELVARLYAYGVLTGGEWPPRATPHRDVPLCQCLWTREQSETAAHVVADR